MSESKFTQELAAEICRRLSSGESLRSICRDEAIPVTETAVRLWAIEDREGFASQYARARDTGMDVLGDDILDIADDGGEDVQRSRLRVDTRKWLMSKIAPKRYGDRLVHANDGEKPFQVNIQSSDANL